MSQNIALSYEFFPPRTETGRLKLADTRRVLAGQRPDFFSVTFGAGGSTRDNTLETVLDIQRSGEAPAAPHLTCVGASNAEILELLQQYRDAGIRHLVVLRGDPPSGLVGMGECKHAVDLVRLVREHHGDHFRIAVAAYPECHPDAPHLLRDLEHFADKMRAGADLALTQYFFNADGYFHFMDRCRALGIEQPVHPGIMPIANFASLRKFSKQCGAEIPRWVRKTMDAWQDDLESQRQFGIELVSRLCEQLIGGGAPGLHFYTMNQSGLTLQILRNLALAGE